MVTDASNRQAAREAMEEKLAHRVCIPVSLTQKRGPADLYTTIPYVVPAQLFAGHLAAVKGLNPDKPRSLKKVTQTL